MGLITVLVRGLRMLLRGIRVFLALGMVAFAMMFSGRTMCLGSIFVMFGCFIMFVSGHCKSPWLFAPSLRFKHLRPELFLRFCSAIAEFLPAPLMPGHHAGRLSGWRMKQAISVTAELSV
jgi:hypothetical protein